MPELVVMVGIQGSGKSTLVAIRFASTHRVVSKDHWPNARRREARQQRLVSELLSSGHSVVVDNTNASTADRAPLVALATELGCSAGAVFVDTPLELCMRRNDLREGRRQVPLMGIYSTVKRLEPPTTGEGFAWVEVVNCLNEDV